MAEVASSIAPSTAPPSSASCFPLTAPDQHSVGPSPGFDSAPVSIQFSEADKQTILTLVASILSAILSANPSLLTSLGSDRSAPAMDQDSQASDRSAMTGSAVDTAAVSMPATAPNVTPRAAVAQSQAPVPQEAQVAIPTASPAPVTTQSPAPLTQAAQVQPMAPLVQPPVGPVAIDPAAPQSSQAHRDGDDDEPNHDGDGSPVAEDRGD